VPAHNALSCQDVSGKARYSRVATSTLLTWPSPMWFFFISKYQVGTKRNPFQVRRCSEGKGKGNGGNGEAIRKGPAALLPTVENSYGAV
jgi:hypothetical protein